MSLKESSRLIEEAKEREVQVQNKLKAMEQQVQVLTERDQEVSSALTHTAVFPRLILFKTKYKTISSLKTLT